MRIVNPGKASATTQADQDDVAAALATLAGEAPTFEEVRAALPAGKRARFTDGMIHQAALDAGLKVIA